MTVEQKKELRNWLKEHIANSNYSNNEFAVKVFGWSKGTMSNVMNKYDAEKVVSAKTWQQIITYKMQKQGYVGVETPNYQSVQMICEMAYKVKSAMNIEGEGGYGKSFALKQYKDKNRDIKVYYIDISLTGNTSKRVVAELMKQTGDYKAGTIQKQLVEIRRRLSSEKALVIFDEVSALQGYHVTVLKDIMTALDEVCGVVLSGTPYFMKNLNRGADRNRHLYNETRDRIFMHNITLSAPTNADALEIFKANGLTDEQIKLVTDEQSVYYWLKKRTFRGIRDAIRLVKMVA